MISSRRFRNSCPFQYWPRSTISSTAPGYFGSLLWGAVPSISATPIWGKTTASKDSKSEEQ